jgi:hypothetical protein
MSSIKIFLLLVIVWIIPFNASAKCVVQQQTVKVGNNIQQQVTETCDDNQKFNVGEVGFSGNLELFKPHVNYTNNFYHNGSICRWFMNNMFNDNDVISYEGIICQVGDKWTVVDKF